MAMLRGRTIFNNAPGGPFLSIMHFVTASAPPTSADATLVVSRMAAFWAALAPGMTLLAWTAQGDVEVINPATGDLVDVVSAAPSSSSGSDATERLPFLCQGIINWRTSEFVDGRRVQGHTNVPGPCSAGDIDGVPTTGYQTRLNTAGAILIGGSGVQLAVWQRPRIATLTLPARVGSVHTVTSFVSRGRWGVLRSRRN